MGKNGKPCGIPGDRYVPYEERTGNQSIVYFTRDLSAAGLRKIYERVDGNITGNVGVKLHTGEKNGPNIIPREWVRELLEKDLPQAAIIETNTYYEGDRYTTEAGCSLCRRPYSTSGPLRDKPQRSRRRRPGVFPAFSLPQNRGGAASKFAVA